MPFDSVESIQPLLIDVISEKQKIRASTAETANPPGTIAKLQAIRSSVKSVLNSAQQRPNSREYDHLNIPEQAIALSERGENPRLNHRCGKQAPGMYYAVHDTRRVPGKIWLLMSGVLLITAAVAFIYNTYPTATAQGADPRV